MGFWGWVGAIAAGWFAASLVLAAFWSLLGKRIRPRPVPPCYDGEQGDARTISFQSGGDVS